MTPNVTLTDWWFLHQQSFQGGFRHVVRWVSDDERYVLVGIPGETYYSPGESVRPYSPAHIDLIDTRVGHVGTVLKTYERRFSRAVVEDAKRTIREKFR